MRPVPMYVLSKKYGRLCNRLFNAAHLLALAIERKHTFVNVAFYDYADCFQATQQDILCRYPVRKGFIQNYKPVGMVLYYLTYCFACFVYYLPRLAVNGLRWRTIRGPAGGDDLVLDVPSFPLLNGLPDTAHVIFFQGWNLRAHHSLQKHGDRIREYFTPLPRYRARVNEFILTAREGCDVLVGVVIRHGDYRTWLNGQYFYSLETYAALMKQVEELFGGRKTKFIICSDEEQDTTVFAAAKMDFCFRSGHMIENLYSLAECDYIVSPPSTYGMWASFYGKVPLYLIDDPAQRISTTDSFAVCEG